MYDAIMSYGDIITQYNCFLIFSGLLFWLTMWLIMGIPAGPGGQLFTLAILTLAAHLGGWALQKATTLPALIGMLIMGVILKNVGFVQFDKDYHHVVSYIRYLPIQFHLVFILIIY